jgi:osmoprotectant transport system ATP-binding protein
LIQYDTPEIILACPANQFISDFVGTDRAIKTLGLYMACDAMSEKPDIIIQGSMSSPDALNRFDPEELADMIVIHENKPIGYIDIQALRNRGAEVKDAVIAYPVLINSNDNLRNVMSHILMHNIRQFPVIDDKGDLSGVISEDDIRRLILKIFDDCKDGTGQ